MGTSAELISSRIRIVADKLDLKSNEAKKKGNENAARALMTSVGHLHDASQFILNLDRQHSEVKALREEISKANDKVDKHGDFSKKIEQVKRMLMKKSEEMEVKGNKNACAALRESAATINQAQEMLLTYATMNAELKRSINFNDSVMKKIKLSLFSENADILKEDEFVSVLTHGANIIKVLREKYEGRSDEEIFNQIRSDEYIVQDSNKGDDKVSALEAEVLRLKEIDEELRIAMMKIGALSEENDRLYADIKVIRNRYDAEHIKLQENEDFLAKKDEEFKSLSDQLNISKSTSDEHMHLISSLQEECKLQHRMAQKAEEQYHQAKIELETLQKTLEENSGKISAYQAELNRSEDKRNDAEAMLAKSKNDIQLLQEELKDLLKIANLNADTVKNSANLENKIKQLNEELIHRRKESTLFEADKKAADDLNHRLVQKCCSIKNTLDEVRMTLMNIRKSKSSVIEQDISSFRSVPEDLKDFLQELISHLKLYRKERVDFSETKEELANMGSRLDAIALSCKDEISRIEDEIIRNKFADVTDSFAIVERSIFVLASSLHQLRTSRLNVEVQPQQELEKLKERADLFEKEAHKAQKRLTEVEKEFDMYRHKSHSALKKIEKRAELLNGMRKDNDLLTKKLREYKSRESEQQHEIECARMRVLQLENICMMTREEMAQRLYSERALIVEEYRKNNELRNQVEYSKKIRKELMVFNENLQEEKNEIARAKMSLHVDESREKDLRIQRLDAELTSKQSSTNDLEQKCVALEAELKEILDKVGTYEHFNAEIIKILDDGNNSLALTNDISLVDQVRKVMIERNALINQVDELNEQVKKMHVQGSSSSHHESSLMEKLDLGENTNNVELVPRADIQENFPTQSDAFSIQHVLQLENQIMNLKSDADRMQEDHEAAISKMTELQSTISHHKELEFQVTLMKRELERANKVKPLPTSLDFSKSSSEIICDDGEELTQMKLERQNQREDQEFNMNIKKCKQCAEEYIALLHSFAEEMHIKLENHAILFREASQFRRDTEGATYDVEIFLDDIKEEKIPEIENSGSTEEFEEFLVMNSGVVVKAGGMFSLPVVCEQIGSRVTWKFIVAEDGADVAFSIRWKCSSSVKVLVEPERVTGLNGTFDVTEPATLEFEWDNTYSWLTEKTLDYHVSILVPITEDKKKMSYRKMLLNKTIEDLKSGVNVLEDEYSIRMEIEDLLCVVNDYKASKEECLHQIDELRKKIRNRKHGIEEKVEAFHKLLQECNDNDVELDEMEKQIIVEWEASDAERSDAETTIHLAKGNCFEAYKDVLLNFLSVVENELKKLE